MQEYILINEKIEEFLRPQIGYFISGNLIVFDILGVFGKYGEGIEY